MAILNNTEPTLTTTYLTKEIDGRTHHYRATVVNNGVDIVQGVLYERLSMSWEGCDNNEKAVIRQRELVAEKIDEDYIVAENSETLEDIVYIYDKAKWHFDGNFPEDLGDFQGYIHTGMFLGWLIDKDLVSKEFKDDNNEDIEQFQKRELTGPQIFERCCDGVLLFEDISEMGNRFSLPYFDFTTGQYLNDYETTLSQDESTLYHIKDTWDNYFKIKKVLDQRFDDWAMQDDWALQNNKKLL